jgi:1-pyrroline dehydrogenase
MSVALARYQNYVGGAWVDAIDGDVAEVINPANETVIAAVPSCGPADVDRAVEAARKALPEWLDSTPQERSMMLLKLAEAVEENAEEFARLESLNVGKPLPMARDEVLIWCVDTLRFFSGAARCLEGRSAGEYLRGYTSMIRREPVGVVGQVTPWNYPLLEALLAIAPSLAAGNATILKPAEETPMTTLKLAEVASEIFPPGVLNVVTGDGNPVGAALVSHPGVNMVSLIGDVETGKLVARAAADTLKRVHLELGGKAPVLVFDDADPEAVTQAIKIAGYFNAGQECTAATRVLAGPKIYDRLLEDLVPAVESLRVGDPSESEEIDMGPLITKRQQERVLGFIDRAVEAKATVLIGGASTRSRGFYIEPAVVVDVDQKSEIVQKEVFGPVVTVQRFSSDDEAIARANDVAYGLAASVWTRDVSRALNATRKLQFGTVWVNDHLVLAAEMPHGGLKQSGYGKDFSVYSLEDYTQIKHVMMKHD